MAKREAYKLSILAALGGMLYMGVELLWRGRTHWTMGIVGGVCFVLIGGIERLHSVGNADLEAGGLRQCSGDRRGAGGGYRPEFISGPRHLGLLGPALQPAGTDLPAVQPAVDGVERSLHLCGRRAAACALPRGEAEVSVVNLSPLRSRCASALRSSLSRGAKN